MWEKLVKIAGKKPTKKKEKARQSVNEKRKFCLFKKKWNADGFGMREKNKV